MVNYRSAKVITYDDYIDIDTCECGGPVFKYTNVSKNIYVVKCGHVKEIYETEKNVSKKKSWIKSKKQPCKFLCVYHGARTTFYKKPEKVKSCCAISENPHIALKNILMASFNFLFLTGYNFDIVNGQQEHTVLQEINLLVKNKLKRNPRIIYYYPSTTGFLRESHRESLENYKTRIFSKEIIDKSITFVKPVIDYKIYETADIEELAFEDIEEPTEEVDPDEIDPEEILLEEAESDDDTVSELSDIEIEEPEYEEEPEEYEDYDD